MFDSLFDSSSALIFHLVGYGAQILFRPLVGRFGYVGQQAEDYLAHISESFFSGGAQRAVLWGEDAAEEILDYAGQQKVDLIAMATHGRTGLARMLMGSVASKLLQARAAPLFMVRPEALNE